MAVLLLAACPSETEISPKDPAPPPEDPAPTCPEAAPAFLPGDGACRDGERGSGWSEPQLEWALTTFEQFPDSIDSLSSPVVAQLTDDDGDGDVDAADQPDLVVITRVQGTFDTETTGTVRVIRGDGTGVHWSLQAHDVNDLGQPAVADLDGDGVVEILVPLKPGVLALDRHGRELWSFHQGNDEVNQYDGVTVADLDGDGAPEVLYENYVLDAGGTLQFTVDAERGNWSRHTPVVAELDGDDQLEILIEGRVYEATGAERWSANLVDAVSSAADVDGDGIHEVIVLAEDTLSAYEADGQRLWQVAVPSSPALCPPSAADIDGDGAHEIALFKDEQIVALDDDGTLLWRSGLADWTRGCPVPTSFDFDADGASEWIVSGMDDLRILEGTTGGLRWSTPKLGGQTGEEFAFVADVDGDDAAELVVVYDRWETTGDAGIAVFGGSTGPWPQARSLWNQHSYLPGLVDDLGRTVPASDIPLGPLRGNVAPLPGPDLTLFDAGLCDLGCASGQVELLVHPGNLGSEPTADIVLVLYAVVNGVETYVDRVDLGAVAPCSYDEAVRLVAPVDPSVEALVLRASQEVSDPWGDNELLRWEGPFCRGPDRGIVTPAVAKVVPQEEPDLYFMGEYVAATDLDGDGFAEAIASVRHDVYIDTLHVSFGGPGGIDASRPPQLISVPKSGFGAGVSAVGDLDGDGHGDLATIGAITRDLYVAYGGPDGIDPARVVAFTSPDGTDTLSVAGADFDGDGFSDLVTGHPYGSPLGISEAGLLHVWPGGPSGVDPLTARQIEEAFPSARRNVGLKVSVIGDANGDGYPDVAALADHYEDESLVVWYGSAAGLDPLSSQQFQPSAVGGMTTFGAALAGGDLDDDGYAELVVGLFESHMDFFGLPAGSVRIFRGTASGIDPLSEVRLVVSAPGSGADFGWSVAVGEVDGDRFPDVLMGAPGGSASGNAVYVAHGGPAGVDPTVPPDLVRGESAATAFGKSVAAADLDGDGLDDLVVGASNDRQLGVNTGAMFVYLSETCDLDDDDYCPMSGDCDDGDASSYPGAPEGIGDGVDSDCDGQEACYLDPDQDGWGDPANTVVVDGIYCPPVTAGDCDDSDAGVHPDAAEICGNGVDEDCDGAGLPGDDEDGDGMPSDEELAAGRDPCGPDEAAPPQEPEDKEEAKGSAKPGGCGCTSGPRASGGLGLAVALLVWRRRSRTITPRPSPSRR